MKPYMLLLALLQSLGSSGEWLSVPIVSQVDAATVAVTFFPHVFAGLPLHNSELESMADRGLGAALAQVNSVYAVSHLYRVTRGSVTRVSLHIPKDILSCFFLFLQAVVVDGRTMHVSFVGL